MNNLRHLRQEKGLSIQKLHELTGYPIRTLEDWDSNKRQITSYHRIMRLSAILECDTDDLMIWSKMCLYGSDIVGVEVFQDEDGVHVDVYGGLDLDSLLYNTVISREKALELIKYLKTHKNIQPFFAEEEQK